MTRSLAAAVVTSMLFIADAVSAMPPAPEPVQQYPVMEGIAKKVIEKYQTSSCQQLWAEKGQAPTPEQIQTADAARATFSQWHSYSMIVNLLTVILVTGAMGLAAVLPEKELGPAPTPPKT